MAGSKSRLVRRKVRPDTPMPATRHCTNCGNCHGIPTGKRCAVKAAARSITPDELSSNRLVAPLCEDEIQADFENRASSSPVQVNSDSNGWISGNANNNHVVSDNPSTGPGSLHFLADTMVILHKKSELRVLRQERHVNHSWQQLQGIHDTSRIINVNTVILSDSPPRLEPVRQPAHVQPAAHPQTVTLNTQGPRRQSSQGCSSLCRPGERGVYWGWVIRWLKHY